MASEFRSHPIYLILVTGILLLFGLLGWDLLQNPTPAGFLFIGITVAAALWFLMALGVQITFTPTAITINRPYTRLLAGIVPIAALQPTQTIAHRQLVTVEESGRLLSSITLLYYPIQADGLLDLEQIAAITLPLVVNQSDLFARLEAVVPQ